MKSVNPSLTSQTKMSIPFLLNESFPASIESAFTPPETPSEEGLGDVFRREIARRWSKDELMEALDLYKDKRAVNLTSDGKLLGAWEFLAAVRKNLKEHCAAMNDEQMAEWKVKTRLKTRNETIYRAVMYLFAKNVLQFNNIRSYQYSLDVVAVPDRRTTKLFKKPGIEFYKKEGRRQLTEQLLEKLVLRTLEELSANAATPASSMATHTSSAMSSAEVGSDKLDLTLWSDEQIAIVFRNKRLGTSSAFSASAIGKSIREVEALWMGVKKIMEGKQRNPSNGKLDMDFVYECRCYDPVCHPNHA